MTSVTSASRKDASARATNAPVAALAAAKSKRNLNVKRTTLLASALCLAIASFGSLADDKKDAMEHPVSKQARHDPTDKMERADRMDRMEKKNDARRTKQPDSMERGRVR
jgi:hypothetical protein